MEGEKEGKNVVELGSLLFYRHSTLGCFSLHNLDVRCHKAACRIPVVVRIQGEGQHLDEGAPRGAENCLIAQVSACKTIRGTASG